MKINKDDILFGFPILEIRKLLKKGIDSSYSTELLKQVLNIKESTAQHLINNLLQGEFIRKDRVHNGTQYYENEMKGNALAMASAAKPIKRKTAEEKLSGFLERVEVVNNDPYYLYKIEKVEVFGSFLTDKPEVNDIDLIVHIIPKIELSEAFTKLIMNRADEAQINGRQFSNFTDRLDWPRREVILFLKSRSRVLSIHTPEDDIVNLVKKETVYKR